MAAPDPLPQITNTLVTREPSIHGPRPMAKGIKVEGEGEWNARKHGGSKRRVWRTLHIGNDEMEEAQETVRGTVSPTTTGNPRRRVHHQRHR